MKMINREEFKTDEEFKVELRKIKDEIFGNFKKIDIALKANLQKNIEEDRIRNIKTLEQSRSTFLG